MPFAGLKNLLIPCLLIAILLLLLAYCVDRRSAFYSGRVDKEISGDRFHAIDGLRGFLAIFVLYHHAVISYFYYATGQWVPPPSRLATLFGQGSVAMFFMITALLFWHRALASNGRIDLNQFYSSRIRRMLPMYMVASGLVVLTALAFTHFRLNHSPMQLIRDASTWLLFTFLGTPDVNGFPQTGLINTVFWSLVYEWKFYFLFPLLMFFARGWLSFLLLAVTAMLIHWYSSSNIEWYFVYGGLAATLIFKLQTLKKVCSGKIGSAAILLSLGAIMWLAPTAYSEKTAPLFFIPFLLIASGNSMFGLLTSRPARLLGTISYSFYLLHNFVLYLVFRAVNHLTDVSSLSVSTYWFITSVIAVLTFGISAVTYRYIEFPFLNLKLPTSRSVVNDSVEFAPHT